MNDCCRAELHVRLLKDATQHLHVNLRFRLMPLVVKLFKSLLLNAVQCISLWSVWSLEKLIWVPCWVQNLILLGFYWCYKNKWHVFTAGFRRPVVIYGGVSDICRTRLIKEVPELFDSPHPSEQDAGDSEAVKTGIIKVHFYNNILMSLVLKGFGVCQN